MCVCVYGLFYLDHTHISAHTHSNNISICLPCHSLYVCVYFFSSCANRYSWPLTTANGYYVSCGVLLCRWPKRCDGVLIEDPVLLPVYYRCLQWIRVVWNFIVLYIMRIKPNQANPNHELLNWNIRIPKRSSVELSLTKMFNMSRNSNNCAFLHQIGSLHMFENSLFGIFRRMHGSRSISDYFNNVGIIGYIIALHSHISLMFFSCLFQMDDLFFNSFRLNIKN